MLEKMRKIDECDVEKFDSRDSSDKTIAIILGGRWWPQTAKQEGDKDEQKYICHTWKKAKNVMSTETLEGVPIRSRNGTPSREGCVVNGQMTKASNK